MGESQSNFIVRARNRFSENGGKLFLVDDAKFHALEALLFIIKEAGPHSLLIIAENTEAAAEIAEALRGTGKECETVADEKAFRDLAAVAHPSDELYRKRAETFAREHPVLVFSAADGDGAPLLHRVLCDDNAKSGVYYGTDGRQAAFCISDFLAECRYAFVAVDAVFTLLDFRSDAERNDPLAFDHLDFAGKDYYTDLKHSYRRLKNLTGAAKQCVVLSDTLFEHDAAELYAALGLLHDAFSFVDARTRIRGLTQDYDAVCELIYNDVSNCKKDENVLSWCVQRAQNSPQRVPRDISSMGDYLERKLIFSSEEEIFLQAVTAYIAARFGGRNVTVEEVVESMEQNMMEMAECFLGMYFRDTVKGELESAVRNTQLYTMSAQEIEAVYAVFARYGVCHSYGSAAGSDKIVRIYRDDSAFENVAEKYLPASREGETEYAFICADDRDVLKCYTLARLFSGKESIKLQLPALIVTRDGTEDRVGKQFTAYSGIKTQTIETFDGKSVMVADYSHLRRMAKKPSFDSAVFYDFIPDLFLFMKIRNKISGMGKVQTVVLCDDMDFGDILMNEWRKEIFSAPFGFIPFGDPKIETKQETMCPYSQITEEIADCYIKFRLAAERGTPGEEKDFSKRFLDLVSVLSENDIKTDMQFFTDTAKHTEAIFANAITVGRHGEAVEWQAFEKGKRTSTPMPGRLFFNVCSRYLYRRCDIKANDCHGCEKFKTLTMNDFGVFKSEAEAFFKAALKYVEWRKKWVYEKLNEIKINNDTDSRAETNGLEALILEKRKEASAALEGMSKAVSACEGPASVGYDEAKKVLGAVTAVDCRILAKYVTPLLEIFDANSQQMRKVYTAVCEGLRSALVK